MLLNRLLDGWLELPPGFNPDIGALSTSSQRLGPDTLWLAPRGLGHHALDYHRPELRPAAIVYEPPYANPPAGALALPQLSAHIGAIAARFYGQPGEALRLVGITGTDGKSSLVYLLAEALPDCAMLGTIGYGPLGDLRPASHTTPEALRVQQELKRFVDAGLQVAALEVSSHALVQNRVAAVPFDIGVFSNLSRDHLDYHPDMEAYFQAKATLFHRPLKTAIINGDDAAGRRLLAEGHIQPGTAVIVVSSRDAAPVPNTRRLAASAIELLPAGLRFTLSDSATGRSASVASPLLARFNVDNLLNVAACLLALGLDFDTVVAKLAGLHGVVGRAEALPLAGGGVAIIDYAHTPNALENILRGIRPHVAGRLLCVFGCGGDRDPGKRPLMGAVAVAEADGVILTDDNPRHEDPAAIIAAIAADLDPKRFTVIQPREQAIRFALDQLRPGDAVVIAGKGHEDYQIIGSERHYFSDRAVVEAYDAQRR